MKREDRSNFESNKEERQLQLQQAHRHLAWRIMVYLKAHPTILSENCNQEIYEAVRDIQIRHRLRATPKYTREEAADLVDFMCELEANHKGADYYVEQREMDLYRPSAEKNKEWQIMFYITLMCYDDGCYTKEIHEAVLAEEEAERKQIKNG